MQEDINQKISRLIDGELGYDETLDLLKKIRSDEALKHKMSRYQAISQALKTDEFYQVKADFSAKVFQQIQHEPTTYLLPQKLSQHRQPKRTKLFAVAASAIVVAILVGQSLRDNSSTATALPSLAATTLDQQPLPGTIAQAEKVTQLKKGPPLNAQFNDYLQAHNNSVYTNGEANFQPYTKVTSYGRD
jgi:sigma-E factor negative regulatory protein RseA